MTIYLNSAEFPSTQMGGMHAKSFSFSGSPNHRTQSHRGVVDIKNAL